MMKQFLHPFLLTAAFFQILSFPMVSGQELTGRIDGRVQTAGGNRIPNVTVVLKEMGLETTTNSLGKFVFENIPYGDYQIMYRSDEFEKDSARVVLNSGYLRTYKTLSYVIDNVILGAVEVVGELQPINYKLDNLNRIPLLPTEQIQSFFVLDNKIIERQGATKVSDVTNNVSGIYVFATHGGVKEAMSIRGFRGVPLMKNGILISKDKGGRGFATDFEGIEAVQVIKGANSVNLGVGTSYGNAGGTINLVTKTPHFVNRGQVGVRIGSFNQYRTTFDMESLLGKKNRAAFRLNGAYENSRTYQNIAGIGKESFYINPSVAIHPDDKTMIILEADHYNVDQAFDPGTENLSVDNSENDLYQLPKKRFLGFEGNNTIQTLTTGSLRVKRELNEKLFLRASALFSNYDTKGPSSALTPLPTDSARNINV